MSEPLVSVCVVTYNHELYIEECLLSVLRQVTDFSYEVIVGEDCSTDRTRQIVERLAQEHPDVIIPVCHEKNIGASCNYIQIHGLARGRFIAHLDGDDSWFPGKLQAQVDFLNINGGCSAVYTNALVVDREGRKLGEFCDCSCDQFDLNYFISGANFLVNSSTMYRSIYRKQLLSRSSDNLLDYAVHLILLRCGPVGFIDSFFVCYRSGVINSAISKNSEFVFQEILNLLKEVREVVDPRCFSIGMGVQKANRFLSFILNGKLTNALGLFGVVLCGESWRISTISFIQELGWRISRKLLRKILGGARCPQVAYRAPRK